MHFFHRPVAASLRRFCPEIIAATAAFAAYVNVPLNDYCYDDVAVVQHNPQVNDPGRWLDIWRTDYWSPAYGDWQNRDLLYRPVAVSSFRLVRSVLGPSPAAQFLVNILLHALNCVLLLRLCRQMHLSESAAFISGLFFAVLPIHTEALASVVGRADLLATSGILVALIAQRRTIMATSGGRRLGWIALAAVATFIAVGAKESGVAVAPILMAFEGYWRRRPESGDSLPRGAAIWTAIRIVVCLTAVAAYVVLRHQALEGRLLQTAPLDKAVNVLADASPSQHALGALQLWGMYWAKTFWPRVLAIGYSIQSIRLATSFWDVNVLIGCAALVIMAALSIAKWRGRRAWLLVCVCLVLAYLPTANVLVMMRVFFAERTWYLPSVWAAVLIGFAVAPILRWRAAVIACGVLGLAMMARCWARNAEWRDNGTLYAAAHRDLPEAIQPLFHYGNWLLRQGRLDQGAALLEQAVTVHPGYTDAHRSLGLAYLAKGELEAALRSLQIADMQVPNHGPTREALAEVSRELSRVGDAEIQSLKEAAGGEAPNARLEIAYVGRLQDLGRLDDALRRFDEREAALSGSADWQAAYAAALVLANRRTEAIAHYEMSLALDPDDAQHLVELAMLLIEERSPTDLERAGPLCNRAIQLAPNTAATLLCQAELHAALGDTEKARRFLRRAIEGLPPSSPQRRILQERIRTLGG